MVSALTGRLLANLNSGCASSSSSSGGEGSQQRLSSIVVSSSQQQSSTRRTSVSPPSCYSIDTSTTSSSSTNKSSSSSSSRGGLKNKRSSEQQQSGSSSKRQKQCDEKAYAASTAFACLKKAGRKIPTIRTSCPRGLPPLSGINMGQNVTLVHSKNFIPPVFMANSMLSFNDDLCSALIQATSSFYQLPSSSSSSHGGGDCDSNGTSSVTDETSSNSGSTTQEENEIAAERIISMGEALQITKHPRIVTLASAPFNVVHVNAAYLSLTGLPSTLVLGRPFHEIVTDKDWASLLVQQQQAEADVVVDFELTQIHGASFTAKSLTTPDQQQESNCGGADVKVCVTKIGAQPSKISHFAVELHPSATASSVSSLDAPIRPTITTATSFGMVVA